MLTGRAYAAHVTHFQPIERAMAEGARIASPEFWKG